MYVLLFFKLKSLDYTAVLQSWKSNENKNWQKWQQITIKKLQLKQAKVPFQDALQ